MDVTDAMAARRMVRSFDGSPLDQPVVTSIFEEALRAPTAGNARGIEWVVLLGASEVAAYFDAATDESWRLTSARAPGLRRASAIGICLADPAAYAERYAEDDKSASGLGAGPDAWPVPYWIGDAGASTMAALLLASEAGLDAAFLGAFRRVAKIKEAMSIPEELIVYGAVLLGHSDGADHRSRSLDRAGPTRAERIHRGRYSAAQPSERR